MTIVQPASHPAGVKEVHEVWAWNLDEEFRALMTAVSSAASGTIVALDMEFPGFLRQEPRLGPRAVRYQALRENVDKLRPIQLGAAVAGADGVLRGVWSFNLQFNVDVDLHTKKSVAFLRAAGIDFPRHASEGIEAALLGRHLASSMLIGQHGKAPWWLTFSGSYDLGYLLKLLTSGKPLPSDFSDFDGVLAAFCPYRHELRDQLPVGSLDALAREHGIQRYGTAHTAGSDALLTLELYLKVAGEKSRLLHEGRMNSYGNENWNLHFGVVPGWYTEPWDSDWNSRWGWEAATCAPSFPPAPWPALSNLSVPALAGGLPMPSATFWHSAGRHKVATGKRDSKVLEI